MMETEDTLSNNCIIVDVCLVCFSYLPDKIMMI